MAQQKVGLKLNVARADLHKVLAVLPAMKAPTISPLADEDWVAIEVIVDELQVRDLIPQLKEAGARDIIEYPPQQSRALNAVDLGSRFKSSFTLFHHVRSKSRKGKQERFQVMRSRSHAKRCSHRLPKRQ